ncbi:hypothetical protein K1719_016381 [Acacia pycnantha]|nr:hypothetical protein K1719_016381 [Acacia pycnantha]
MCRNINPALVVLADTRCEEESKFAGLIRWGFDGFAMVPSVGRSGGIVALWRSSMVDLSVVRKSRQFIHLKGTFGGSHNFLLTAIYALPYENLKQVFWNELFDLSKSIFSSWVVLGDFNDILSVSERTGGAGFQEARASRFFDRLQECKLSDLGSIGPQFTWRGPCAQGHRRLFERLDRAVANEYFLRCFTDSFLQVEGPRSRFLVPGLGCRGSGVTNFYLRIIFPNLAIQDRSLPVLGCTMPIRLRGRDGSLLRRANGATWRKPRVGRIKLNVDGVIAGSSRVLIVSCF